MWALGFQWNTGHVYRAWWFIYRMLFCLLALRRGNAFAVHSAYMLVSVILQATIPVFWWMSKVPIFSIFSIITYEHMIVVRTEWSTFAVQIFCFTVSLVNMQVWGRDMIERDSYISYSQVPSCNNVWYCTISLFSWPASPSYLYIFFVVKLHICPDGENGKQRQRYYQN